MTRRSSRNEPRYNRRNRSGTWNCDRCSSRLILDFLQMNAHDTDQVLSAAVYAAVARAYDNERSIEDAADEILDAIEADRQRRGEPVADCWSNDDGDNWLDHPAESDLVDGLKVGDEYDLLASVSCWTERFRVIKAPDETSDDFEVEPVSIRTAPQPADPDYKQLYEQMCERCDALDAKLAEYSEREPVARVNDDGFIVETGLGLAPGTLLYTAPQPAAPEQVPSDDERAAQGLPPYSPRHMTEEEWNRLTENGRRAWGKKPDEPEKEPPCDT